MSSTRSICMSTAVANSGCSVFKRAQFDDFAGFEPAGARGGSVDGHGRFWPDALMRKAVRADAREHLTGRLRGRHRKGT